MASLAFDVRHAVRTLRHHPGFSTVVILTLGLGIGINTATFSIVNAVLIRPLEFAQPERLVALQEVLPTAGLEGAPFSPPDYLDIERDQKSFEGVAAYSNVSFELSETGEPIRIDAAKVSSSLFDVLGVRPLLGRVFTASEDRPGFDLAVLSWRLWQTRYSGDPGIVGKTITLDRRPYSVIGVMSPTFEFPRRGPQSNNKPASLWVPMAFMDFQLQLRGNDYNYNAVGRLRDGVSIDQARAELGVLATQIYERYPPLMKARNFSMRLSAEPLRQTISGRVEQPLLFLLAAVGLVLLVTCTNVANLILSKAAARTREIAIRTALGSSRARLLQLLLAEAAVLSIAGAVLGVLISQVLTSVVPSVVTEALPGAQEVSIDLRVLAFTAAIAIATAILFALIPLVIIDRGVPGPVLQQEASRTTPGRHRHRVQAGLVVSTVMLAFVLLVGAGLFIRSFSALMAIDTGFSSDRVLTASLMLPRAGYGTAASIRGFQDRLLTRISSMPDVRSTALMTDLPLERYERRGATLEGVDVTRGSSPVTNLSWVRGPYFQTLGIRLKSGRLFSEVEDAEARWVIVVNERLARTFWPGQEPLGKRLRWGPNLPQNPNRWLTVIGVIADVTDGPLGVEPFIHAYEPFSQFPDFVWNNIPTNFGRVVKLAARTDGDPRALSARLRTEILGLDRQLAIESIETLDDRVGEVVAPRRFSAMTLAGFAAGSLLLAAIGLYGLLSFNVAERRREIAVRLALGAEPPAIRRMVLGQGLKLVFAGLVMGIAVAYAAARAVSSLLYRTESHDLVTFGAVPIVLLLISIVACALPAYRASRVEPMAALRTD